MTPAELRYTLTFAFGALIAIAWLILRGVLVVAGAIAVLYVLTLWITH